MTKTEIRKKFAASCETADTIVAISVAEDGHAQRLAQGEIENVLAAYAAMTEQVLSAAINALGKRKALGVCSAIQMRAMPEVDSEGVEAAAAAFGNSDKLDEVKEILKGEKEPEPEPEHKPAPTTEERLMEIEKLLREIRGES